MVFNTSHICLVWMSHSGLVLGHRERKSSESSVTHCQAMVFYQRHRLRLFKKQLHSWQHVMGEPRPVMNDVRLRVAKG